MDSIYWLRTKWYIIERFSNNDNTKNNDNAQSDHEWTIEAYNASDAKVGTGYIDPTSAGLVSGTVTGTGIVYIKFYYSKYHASETAGKFCNATVTGVNLSA